MTVQILRNPAAVARGTSKLSKDISLSGARTALAEISTWPGYAITPLHELNPIAEACLVGSVLYKDEGGRFGIGSFKALGGAYAVARLLQRRVSERVGRPVSTAELAAKTFQSITQTLTVVTATDGNHGRSVAAGAQWFGCQCVVLIHSTVSEGRRRAIEARGARVIRTEGNFDDSVREASRLALQDDWALVADTSSQGGTGACADVMNGYTVMMSEVLDQLAASGAALPSHVFIQAGVGGLAAALCAHLWQRLGERAPIVVIVEPQRADCLFQTAKAGKLTPATGDLDTVMAGLACGEVSDLAWEILEKGAEFFMTIPDSAAVAAMRLLADKARAGVHIVGGESGVAGLAGFMATAMDTDARHLLALNAFSRILLIGTEGATDPEVYTALVTPHVAAAAPGDNS